MKENSKDSDDTCVGGWLGSFSDLIKAPWPHVEPDVKPDENDDYQDS